MWNPEPLNAKALSDIPCFTPFTRKCTSSRNTWHCLRRFSRLRDRSFITLKKGPVILEGEGGYIFKQARFFWGGEEGEILPCTKREGSKF